MARHGRSDSFKLHSDCKNDLLALLLLVLVVLMSACPFFIDTVWRMAGFHIETTQNCPFDALVWSFWSGLRHLFSLSQCGIHVDKAESHPLLLSNAEHFLSQCQTLE